MDAACFDFGEVCEQSGQQLVGTTCQLARVGQEVDVRDMLQSCSPAPGATHSGSRNAHSVGDILGGIYPRRLMTTATPPRIMHEASARRQLGSSETNTTPPSAASMGTSNCSTAACVALSDRS